MPERVRGGVSRFGTWAEAAEIFTRHGLPRAAAAAQHAGMRASDIACEGGEGCTGGMASRVDALNGIIRGVVLESPSSQCLRRPGWLRRYRRLLHGYESAAVTVVSIHREAAGARGNSRS